MATIERQLQQNLNKIENWATSNGFKFSKRKTQCVHFCQLRKQHDDPVLHLYGSPIPVVEESKFLGILFDRKLSFIPHIKYLKAKCLKALNLLKVLSHTSWGADRTTLLKLYRSLVGSKLDYGCIIYGSARKSYLQMLDPIHNQGLRLALGAFRTSPVASLYVEADEPSLYSRREKLSLQYAVRLAANPSNPAHEVTFPPNYVNLYEQKPKAIKSFGIRISPLLESANIKPQNIEKHFTPNIPAWCMKPPEILFDLHSGKKSESKPHILKDDFRKMQSRYNNYQQIYTDGSKEDSKVGCAVISDNHSNMQRIPDDSSIFTAEAKAIDLALDFITTCDAHNKFIIFSDSLSVLKAMNHTSSKNPQVQKLLEKCHDMSFQLIKKLLSVGFLVIQVSKGMRWQISKQKQRFHKNQLLLKFHFPILSHLSINISWKNGKLHGITALVINFLTSNQLVVNTNQLFETLEEKKQFQLDSAQVMQESLIHTYYKVKSSHNVLVATHHLLYVTSFWNVATLHQ